jgi:hypothetical protein
MCCQLINLLLLLLLFYIFASFSAREKSDWSKVLRAAFTKLFTSVVMATYATEAGKCLFIINVANKRRHVHSFKTTMCL